MKRLGYRTIEGESFFTPDWCKRINEPERNPEAAYRYACRLGFPVVVKPNALSQGAGVSKVYNRQEFMQAVRSFSNKDNVFLVQRVVTGRDYRIVVLNGGVLSAYERTPLSVTGDGRSTIEKLLGQKQKRFRKMGRDTMIKTDDFRIHNCLRRQRLSMDSVPANGERVTLLDNANLSSGGDAIDVTAFIHPTFQLLATRLTAEMGLRFCGVDIMLNGSIKDPCDEYWVLEILEINAAPGLGSLRRHWAAAKEDCG